MVGSRAPEAHRRIFRRLVRLLAITTLMAAVVAFGATVGLAGSGWGRLLFDWIALGLLGCYLIILVPIAIRPVTTADLGGPAAVLVGLATLLLIPPEWRGRDGFAVSILLITTEGFVLAILVQTGTQLLRRFPRRLALAAYFLLLGGFGWLILLPHGELIRDLPGGPTEHRLLWAAAGLIAGLLALLVGARRITPRTRVSLSGLAIGVWVAGRLAHAGPLIALTEVPGGTEVLLQLSCGLSAVIGVEVLGWVQMMANPSRAGTTEQPWIMRHL